MVLKGSNDKNNPFIRFQNTSKEGVPKKGLYNVSKMLLFYFRKNHIRSFLKCSKYPFRQKRFLKLCKMTFRSVLKKLLIGTYIKLLAFLSSFPAFLFFSKLPPVFLYSLSLLLSPEWHPTEGNQRYSLLRSGVKKSCGFFGQFFWNQVGRELSSRKAYRV